MAWGALVTGVKQRHVQVSMDGGKQQQVIYWQNCKVEFKRLIVFNSDVYDPELTNGKTAQAW